MGVAASGRTPFTVAALRYEPARHRAKTVAVTCNRNSELERAAHVAIVAETGAEVVTGSTRMKAGTAQKMILNMLSTGAMARLGYVYGNLMVNVHLKNEKLAERGVAHSAARSECLLAMHAKQALKSAGNASPGCAVVMLQAGVTRKQAEHALISVNGNLRPSHKVWDGHSCPSPLIFRLMFVPGRTPRRPCLLSGYGFSHIAEALGSMGPPEARRRALPGLRRRVQSEWPDRHV